MISYDLSLAQGQFNAQKAWVTYKFLRVMSGAENSVIEFKSQKGY